MALNFDVTECRERLGDKRFAQVTDHPTDENLWHPVVEQVVTYSMVLGFNKITEDNIDEVEFRIALYEQVFNSGLKFVSRLYHDAPEVSGDTASAHINRDDLEKLIGFRCNATTMTRAKFMNRVKEWLQNDTERAVKRRNSKEGAINYCNRAMPRASAQYQQEQKAAETA